MMDFLSLYSGTGPVVLDSPHSGTWYPPDFGYACDLADLRQAEDTHVEKLWSFAAPLGLTFLQANFARSYLDVNRDCADIDEAMIDGPWLAAARPSDKARMGKGLVWQRTLRDTPIYQRKLGAAEVAQRIARCWEPYHGTLARAIGQARARHGYSIHINCHSMPSDPAFYAAEFPGWIPSDFVIGDRQGTTASPALTDWIAEFLRRRGWRVEVNHPYKGVELVRRHAAPAEGRHSVQIEVSRRLYMDEETLALHGGAATVRDTMQALTEALLTQPAATWLPVPSPA